MIFSCSWQLVMVQLGSCQGCVAGYIDCYVRLACIAHGRGDAQQAWHWSIKALEHCQTAQNGASGPRQASEKRDLSNATALKGTD